MVVALSALSSTLRYGGNVHGMDIHLNPDPSPERFNALVALSKSTTNAPRGLHFPTVLKPMLDILGPKSIREFLFSLSPLHVQPLLSSALTQFSLLCATSGTSIDLNAPPPSPSQLFGASQHHAGYHLFVPVCTTGWTTYGVGVCLGVANWQSSLVPHISQNKKTEVTFRFVYDALSRTDIILYEANKDSRYIVRCAHLPNTKSMSAFTGVFSQQQLRDIALSEDELTLSHVFPLLLTATDGVYTINCSICQGSNCNCEKGLPSLSASHYSHFVSEMAERNITCTGTGVNLTFDQETNTYERAAIGSRISQQGVLDRAIVARLTSWAAQEYLGERKESLLRSIEPPQNEMLLTSTHRKSQAQVSHEGRGVPATEKDQNLEELERLIEPVRHNTEQRLPSLSTFCASATIATHEGTSVAGPSDIWRQMEPARGVSRPNLSHHSSHSQQGIGTAGNMSSPLRLGSASHRAATKESQSQQKRLAMDRSGAEWGRHSEPGSVSKARLNVSDLEDELVTQYERIRFLKQREEVLRDENLLLREQLLQKLDQNALVKHSPSGY